MEARVGGRGEGKGGREGRREEGGGEREEDRKGISSFNVKHMCLFNAHNY